MRDVVCCKFMSELTSVQQGRDYTMYMKWINKSKIDSDKFSTYYYYYCCFVDISICCDRKVRKRQKKKIQSTLRSRQWCSRCLLNLMRWQISTSLQSRYDFGHFVPRLLHWHCLSVSLYVQTVLKTNPFWALVDYNSVLLNLTLSLLGHFSLWLCYVCLQQFCNIITVIRTLEK